MKSLTQTFALTALCCALTTLPACAQQSAATERKDAPAWDFVYPGDKFTADALLDLRSLNEKTAGETGFVRLSSDGESFVRGDGKPIRFWAVTSDVYRKTPAEMATHCRFLAKKGVNMVRLHASLSPKAKGAKLTDVDNEEIDRIFRFVAAAKKEGIYVTISPFWANAGHSGAQASWELEGYGDKEDIWGLIFFNDKLRTAYKGWVKALLTRTNPYTGVPLTKDPALAIFSVQNEDSLLFWTSQGIKPEQQKILAAKFALWASKKYGSLEKANAAWDGAKADGDDIPGGKLGLYIVWEMTQPQTGTKAKRVADQTQFFGELQRDFYGDITRYCKNDLGAKFLVNASNWKTADPVKLEDIERWTYTSTDVLAVNKYTGGMHIGENNGWRIDPGHHFTNDSCLLEPRNLPTNLKQVAGHPFLITESTWVTPERYQAEGPFLMAAYQSLTGVDAFYWFAASEVEYAADPYFNFLNFPGGQHAMQKWTCSVPQLMGQFPAAALMYRKSYLKQGAPVVHEERALAQLWNRVNPAIAEDKSFDPNRDSGVTGGQSALSGGVDPLAFLVGPVEVGFGGNSAKSTMTNLTKYLDANAKTVQGETGEVRLNYGKGVCVINAPSAQGVCGFLSKIGAPVKLADVTIASNDEYAAVYVVAMDDKPLKTSGKILVQIGATARPTGWESKPATFKSEDGKTEIKGFEVVNTGKMPYRIAETNVTLTVANPTLKKITLLDTAGYPVREIIGHRSGPAFTVKLPVNTMYAILED